VEVTVLFSLVVPSTAGGSVAQDLYLLWPGEVDGGPVDGPPDPEIRRSVEARGFQVTREGRLPLAARPIYAGRDRPKPEPLAGGPPFVTYPREAGPPGQPAPGSCRPPPRPPRPSTKRRISGSGGPSTGAPSTSPGHSK